MKWEDVMMRSMVDSLPDAESILVPTFFGVRSEDIWGSGCSSRVE